MDGLVFVLQLFVDHGTIHRLARIRREELHHQE
jgi:hypothetical protein